MCKIEPTAVYKYLQTHEKYVKFFLFLFNNSNDDNNNNNHNTVTD